MYAVTALPGVQGAPWSMAFGISSNGYIAGNAEVLLSGTYAQIVGAIWNGGSLVFSLPFYLQADEVFSYLWAVNSKATAVGWRTNSVIPISVEAGVVTDLRPVLGASGRPRDINDAGIICGSSQNRACIFDPASATLTSIDPLPGDISSGASAINQAGEVVGESRSGPGPARAFFYNGGSPRELGQNYEVQDLNDNRVTCGGVSKPLAPAMVPAICDAAATNPTVIALTPPTGFIGGRGHAINNHGHVVGTCVRVIGGPSSAFLNVGGTSTDLNALIADPNWHLDSAQDINDAGHIVGYGTYHGEVLGYLLTPDPTVIRGAAGYEGGDIAPKRTGITVPELTGWLLGGVDVDLGGWIVGPAGPKPVDPWGPFMQLSAPKRDALLALAMDELAMFIGDESARPRIRATLIEIARERLNDEIQQASTGRVHRRARPFGRDRMRAIAEYIEKIRNQF